MKCDHCAQEATEGVSQDWIGVSVASTSTFGAPSGPDTVIETTYDNFVPISTFLCANCYEQRARKTRRNVRLVVLAGLVGIAAFVVAYILLISDLYVPVSALWRNVSGWLAVFGGVLLVKFAWSDLRFRGELLWKPGGRMELHHVLHPHAHGKGKELGCAQVWDVITFKSISSGNEWDKERDRLFYLLETGSITEDEYREKLKQVDYKFREITKQIFR